TTSAYQTDIYLAKLVSLFEKYVRMGVTIQYIHDLDGVRLYQIADNANKLLCVFLRESSIEIHYTENLLNQGVSKVMLNFVSKEKMDAVEGVLNNTNVGSLIKDIKTMFGAVN